MTGLGFSGGILLSGQSCGMQIIVIAPLSPEPHYGNTDSATQMFGLHASTVSDRRQSDLERYRGVTVTLRVPQ